MLSISDIKHIKGRHNIVSNYLSCRTFAVQVDGCDLSANHNPEILKFVCFQTLKKSTTLTRDTQFVLHDTSISYPRPFILDKLCRAIFDSIYLITHLGSIN